MVIIYIQAGDVNTHTPAQILAPLDGKFDAITAYQASNYTAVAALFTAALTAGYETYLWVSPGYVPAGCPAAYNCQEIWPTYPQRWMALHLAAARAWSLNYWTTLAQPYVDAGLLSGIQLDYIRYPN